MKLSQPEMRPIFHRQRQGRGARPSRPRGRQPKSSPKSSKKKVCDNGKKVVASRRKYTLSGFGTLEKAALRAQTMAVRSYRQGGHDPRHLRNGLRFVMRNDSCSGIRVLESSWSEFEEGRIYWFWPAGKSYRSLLQGSCFAMRRRYGTNDFLVFLMVGNKPFAVDARDVYHDNRAFS